MSLPFTDRVAQHMIVGIIEPIFDKRFYEHSYACRKGKGIHKASKALSRWIYEMCEVNADKAYAYSGDVHSYFASINHEILKAEIRRYIRDTTVLYTIDNIIDRNGIYPDGTGNPVGNLTSQLFANVYLNILDRYILDYYKPDHYIRYMDNFIPLDSDLEKIKAIENDIPSFLNNRLRLEINPKSHIISAANGIDFVGYRHFPGMTIMRKETTRKIRRLINDMERGLTDIQSFTTSMQSRIAHIEHADTYNLVKGLREKEKRYEADFEKRN